jgi:mannose-6-phosphate isomerase
LVKLLFTTERLSVQVHPDDAYAEKHHHSLGKTEAWYVMDSQPPGEVAVGFREPITRERLKEGAQTGEIETLLDWRKVEEGDVVFTPAGTVHAIGAGLTICEIQENSDITYRLYDYGRGRELHLEHGAEVSHLGRHAPDPKPISLAPGREELVACEYFRIEKLRTNSEIHMAGGSEYYLLLVCLKGTGTIAGQHFGPGRVWLVPANGEAFAITGPSEWVLTYKSPVPTSAPQ